MADPARHAAAVFAAVLDAKGIRAVGGVATTHARFPSGSRVLAATRRPVAEIIRVVNKESRNLHAEMLLRLVGLKPTGEGSVSRGTRRWSRCSNGSASPHEGWRLTDGSGLARTDLVTPRGLVVLLAAMDRHALALPSATRSRRRPRRHARGSDARHAAEGRVVAKTGTLWLVNALAGYVTTRAANGSRSRSSSTTTRPRARGGAAIDDVAAGLAALR